MKISKEPGIARACIAIMSYLRDHPEAEDTAAGIAQWWVGETHETVSHALDFLVNENAIEKRGGIYRLSKKKVLE